MPLVPTGTSGWFLTLTAQDQAGDTVTKEYELQAIDFTEAQTARDSIIPAFEGVSGCSVINANISYRTIETAPTFGTDDASVKARCTVFKTEGKATFDIPAPLDAIFTAPNGKGFNIVDGTNPQVLAYVALFQLGNSAYISDGENVPATGAFIDGQRVSVRRGKRRV